MITSTGIFSFFQNFDFRVARGIKGQKIVENDKRILSIVLHISGTIHHMIIICGVQVQNLISSGNIFRYFFYFFKTLIFQVVRRVKGQKMAHQNEKKAVCHTLYLRSHTSYDLHLWYTCVIG